ncbi:MAG: butyrate kinase [Candidatus Riflebacteria bacterium HGW-Riflebacteria-1]|jgi:butyrate kinase|nr:MAG: butyrate kinase [Candidatus Riflebacteria bacterium HGW-Riflebacteria-1]
MSEVFKILVVNPGSTSSKLGLFENEKMIAEKKINYSSEELARFPKTNDQVDYRRLGIDEFLVEHNVKPHTLSAVVGRGGLLKPIPSGTYRVTPSILEDLQSARYGEHASNMGALLAHTFTKDFSIPSFIVDPVVVDEYQTLARYSGLKEMPRVPIWHALNVMAVVRQTCKNEGFEISEDNFVVAHIGGGISVSAIERGRCIDVSNGLEAGPFTPERSGALPTIQLVNLCFSGKYTHAEIKKLLVGRGGLVNHLGTSSLMEVENRINDGDKACQEVFDAMCYQIAKEIGAYVAVLRGQVRRIIITGGGAKCPLLVENVTSYVKSFAPVHVVPGEDELSALAMGALRVLRNETEPREYTA